MSDLICPCQDDATPQVIYNPPGRTSISYRVGDFTAFRDSLLSAPTTATGLPTETELSRWRPNAEGDLALQMVEWWAYLCDILTFYNERHANDSYLDTIEQPANLNLLIAILGYRPRPGIAATATLTALVNGFNPITLNPGFQLQSKPGPGSQPQIFEIGAQTVCSPVDPVPLPAPPSTNSLVTTSFAPGGTSTTTETLLVAGVSTGVKKGDELLLVNSDASIYALSAVTDLSQVKDPSGKANTQLSVQIYGDLLPSDAAYSDYRLMKSTQSAKVWQYPAVSVIEPGEVDLDSLVRTIKYGDPILFEVPGTSATSTSAAVPPTFELVTVTSYMEGVWYANPDTSSGQPDPAKPPPSTGSNPSPAIPIPHTYFTFTPNLARIGNSEVSTVVVRYGWGDVGELIAVPAISVTSGAPLVASAPAATPPPSGQPAIVADSHGNGSAATVDGSGNVTLTDQKATLIPPLQILYNLLQVSRGKTVNREILGSGDNTVAGQEFVLQNIPLTYLQSPSSPNGNNYKSTLQLMVNSIYWQEAASFYGAGPSDQIFVTREDVNNQTHVMFGDGVNGARLPSGQNNVIGTYRYGSGKVAPAAGTLSTIVQPQPNLKAILNPVAAGGGSDPDPANLIQQYAPQSVMTFGRAISADDYQTIATLAPGVSRAKSYWTWDDSSQRRLVKIYVGDDAGAVSAAQTAIAGAADPNRPVVVTLATAVQLYVSFGLSVAGNHDPVAAQAAITSALIDPDKGLLGDNVVQIGESVFVSQIYKACIAAPGVLAVQNLQIRRVTGFHLILFKGIHEIPVYGNLMGTDYRFDPGEGQYFQLASDNLTIS